MDKQVLTEEELLSYESLYEEGKITQKEMCVGLKIGYQNLERQRAALGIDRNEAKRKHDEAAQKLRHRTDLLEETEKRYQKGEINLMEYAGIIHCSHKNLALLRQEYGYAPRTKEMQKKIRKEKIKKKDRMTYHYDSKTRPKTKERCRAVSMQECFNCPYPDCIRAESRPLKGEHLG